MIWGDQPAIQVLRHCAEVLPEQGRVLVVEMVMPPGNDPSPARSFDLLMLLANDEGRVRTEAEFRDLFAAAGLRLARVIPTASPNSILEGVLA
jgi:O-methyltransferase domain